MRLANLFIIVASHPTRTSSCRMIKRIVSSAAALALAVVAAPLAAQQPIPGLDAAAIDNTVLPGNDFYHYANGSWERNDSVQCSPRTTISRRTPPPP